MLDRLRGAKHDDAGQTFVILVIVSMVLVGALAVALSSAVAGIGFANRDQGSLQSQLAANSGLEAELAAIRGAASPSAFPCATQGGLSITGAASTYSATATYFAANGTSIACSGANATLGSSVSPASATVVSTGRAASTGQVVTAEANLSIVTKSSLSGALGYAIFSSSNLSLTNAATLNQAGSSGPSPNIYVGQTLTCNNGTSSQGGLTVFSPMSLSNSCSFSGDVVTTGQASLSNSASIGGSL
ncbi:MAG TPA: hypothetical protein VGP46_01915, partial [Acidimicrobiales bacterium]|nr:hypothetical protein [Acidimicrobiales bacterium]